MQTGLLETLLRFDSILIQCHNDPDADAIASAYAIQKYLQAHGKSAPIVYGGRLAVQKSNLLLMLETLGIELRHAAEPSGLDVPDLLITVDCQPGESNVQWIDCRHLAIFDHHEEADNDLHGVPVVYKEVDVDYAACATLVWSRLCRSGFKRIGAAAATALFYGLYTDSNKFQSPLSRADESMRLELPYDRRIIRRFQGSNISQAELEIALKALSGYRHHPGWYFAVTEASYCDPNILGVISDILIEVNVVDVCTVFCVREDHVKLSIRSCIEEVAADALAEYITALTPDSDGGGTVTKAGGKLSLEALRREACRDGGALEGAALGAYASDVLYRRMEAYFQSKMDT